MILVVLSQTRNSTRKGHWFWLKSAQAYGFDVKSFDEKQIYLRMAHPGFRADTAGIARSKKNGT